MTIRAASGQRFVTHHLLTVNGLWTMATFAIDPRVRSFEIELGVPMMIESRGRKPSVDPVAAQAVDGAVRPGELASVLVLMTGRALDSEPGELEQLGALTQRSHMTLIAAQLGVRTEQLKVRHGVIEGSLLPTDAVVTQRAAGSRGNLRRGAGVRILVTVLAGRAREAEPEQLGAARHVLKRRRAVTDQALRLHPQMAPVAGHIAVRSLQCESLVVLRQGEECRREAVDRMTGLTGPAVAASGELPGVLIDMAIGAHPESQATLRSAWPVAALARHLPMFSEQWIPRPSVIQAVGVDAPPAGGGVALLAPAAQALCVWIVVAVDTLIEFKVCEAQKPSVTRSRLLDGCVALLAFEPTMQSAQLKAGLLVAEAVGRQPGALRMAAQACIRLELAAMLVLVASKTLGAKTEKRSLQVLALTAKRRGEPVEVGTMAVTAAELGVPSFETVAGQLVIEGLDPLLTPPDELEVAPMVIDVAALAVGVVRA